MIGIPCYPKKRPRNIRNREIAFAMAGSLRIRKKLFDECKKDKESEPMIMPGSVQTTRSER